MALTGNQYTTSIANIIMLLLLLIALGYIFGHALSQAELSPTMNSEIIDPATGELFLLLLVSIACIIGISTFLVGHGLMTRAQKVERFKRAVEPLVEEYGLELHQEHKWAFPQFVKTENEDVVIIELVEDKGLLKTLIMRSLHTPIRATLKKDKSGYHATGQGAKQITPKTKILLGNSKGSWQIQQQAITYEEDGAMQSTVAIKQAIETSAQLQHQLKG